MVDTTNIDPLADFYLAEGQRLAHMGSWAFDAAGFKHWSSELFVIHGLDPADKAPSIPEYMALVHPEDREFVAQAIEKMLTDHHGCDFTKRIVLWRTPPLTSWRCGFGGVTGPIAGFWFGTIHSATTRGG